MNFQDMNNPSELLTSFNLFGINQVIFEEN